MTQKVEHLLIYGAGGHGKVVLDAARRRGGFQVMGFVDDLPSLQGQRLYDLPVWGGLKRLEEPQFRRCRLVLAVGDNQARQRLSERLAGLDYRFATVVHPAAQIGSGVSLGAGSVVLAGAVLNAEARVGRHAILNTAATVDHDCVIGDFVHLAPGSHLAGGVTVGAGAHLGVGVSVTPGVTIGVGSVIGAGAAVIFDVPPGVTAVGVPARVIRPRP